MTFTTEIPHLTALMLAAAENALTIGTQKIGTLGQVSGMAAGFNIFTPTTDATYQLVIRGQDAASGTPANAFVDVVDVTATGAGWVPASTQTNTLGTPGARTYSNNTGALKIVVANGTTWYLDVVVMRFPA